MKIAGLLLAIATPAMAMAQAPAGTEPGAAQRAPIDAARLKAAETLAASIDLKGQLTAANQIAAGQLETGVLTRILESDPQAIAAKQKDPEKFQKILTALQHLIAEQFKALNAETEPLVYQGTVEIYARNFTTDELAQIQAFYASPFGKKLLERQPQLTRDCIELSQRLLMDRLPALFQRIKERIEADGLTFAGSK